MDRFLIVDVKCSSVIKKQFAQLGLILLGAEEMTQKFVARQWNVFLPWNTLLVFPGNGATIVKQYLEKVDPVWLRRWPYQGLPYARRYWSPGECPFAVVSRIVPGVFVGIKDVVVIDDVVSSGETIRKLYRKNHEFIPQAKWWAACWVKQAAAVTKNYVDVFATKTVGTGKRKVPINSLSTLIENEEIAKSYAFRNLEEQAEAFLEIFKYLR